jgi:hypothetical protein
MFVSSGLQAKYVLSGVFAHLPDLDPSGVETWQAVPWAFPTQASMANCGGTLEAPFPWFPNPGPP